MRAQQAETASSAGKNLPPLTFKKAATSFPRGPGQRCFAYSQEKKQTDRYIGENCQRDSTTSLNWQGKKLRFTVKKLSAKRRGDNK